MTSSFVWVPGASGMLGRAVCNELRARKIFYVGTPSELDISDRNAVETFVASASPPITHVINCAAYTRVDACESPDGAQASHRVNVLGPENLVRVTRDAVTIHVSTDYVFSGEACEPYVETALTDPINAYGVSKLMGEHKFLAAGGTYVVRTSWLFGRTGANFVATMRRLLTERSEVRVVNDQQGRPTFTEDLAHALVKIALQRPAPGIYHCANAEPTTWFGFASAIRDSIGSKTTLIPISTSEYPTPARRPAYSVLSTDKIEHALEISLRSWRDALTDYFHQAAP